MVDCNTADSKGESGQHGGSLAKTPGCSIWAFEAVDIVRRASMKFLQTVRTSAKVKDAARVLVADSMRCWFFSQAYRTDF